MRHLKYLIPDPKSKRYEGVFKHINQKAKLPRIYVLFDEEDPRHFVKRFKHAYQSRHTNCILTLVILMIIQRPHVGNT